MVEEAGAPGEKLSPFGGKLTTLVNFDWDWAHLPHGGFELTTSVLTHQIWHVGLFFRWLLKGNNHVINIAIGCFQDSVTASQKGGHLHL